MFWSWWEKPSEFTLSGVSISNFTFTTPEEHFCLTDPGFYVFLCTYISTFVLDWILETGYLKTKCSFSCCRRQCIRTWPVSAFCQTTKVLCVCGIELWFLRLFSSSHSECHVMISHGVISLSTVSARWTCLDSFASAPLGAANFLNSSRSGRSLTVL